MDVPGVVLPYRGKGGDIAHLVWGVGRSRIEKERGELYLNRAPLDLKKEKESKGSSMNGERILTPGPSEIFVNSSVSARRGRKKNRISGRLGNWKDV